MMKRHFLFVSVVTVCMITMAGCASLPIGHRGPKAPVVYVAGDGTGDFNCTGTSDQLQINEALIYVATHPGFTTVYLKGPREYIINDTVYIDSNTTLTGDSTAAIKLVDHANWPTRKPMVTKKQGDKQNITICGFEINGNDVNNYDYDPRTNLTRYGGHGWYNLLPFDDVTNLSVHHMYLHNNMGDACRPSRCKNVSYYNNKIEKPGHDGLFCFRCDYVDAHDNSFNNRINCSIRLYNTNHAKAYNNKITAEGGGAGIQIEHDRGYVMDDIEIYGNQIQQTRGAAFWIYTNDRQHTDKTQTIGVRVHHNIVYDTRGVGVNLNGFYGTVIENNVFDGCNGAAIRVGANAQPDGTGSQTIIRNNIICNTKVNTQTGAGRPGGSSEGQNSSGIGVISTRNIAQNVILNNNCFFNNPGGDWAGEGIEQANNLVGRDPMFIHRDARDYRLAPGSPCSGAGAYAKVKTN